MTTTKPLFAAVNGPIDLVISGGAVAIEVRAEAVTNVTFTLSTTDDTGAAAAAVRNASYEQSGGQITLRLPEYPTAAAAFGGSNVVIGGTVVDGDVIAFNSHFGQGAVYNVGVASFDGSNINISGSVIGSAAFGPGATVIGQSAVVPPASVITVIAVVPLHSSADLHNNSGPITTTGELDAVTANTNRGDIRIGTAHRVTAETVNGSIRVDNVTGRARLSTVNGPILVHGAEDVRVDASTVNGPITYGRLLDMDASTVNGRVRSVKAGEQ